MAGRPIVDEADAWTCLRAAATAAAVSGEDRASWARRHGIDGRSLNAWRINLERADRARRVVAEPELPELRLVELVASGPRPGRAVGCRVRCGSFVVEVDAEFDDAILGRLLAAVAAC